MKLEFEELTHDNLVKAREIDREDVPVAFVDTADTIMSFTDYGVEHGFKRTGVFEGNDEYLLRMVNCNE